MSSSVWLAECQQLNIPSYVGKEGLYLRYNPHDAMTFETEDECEEFCLEWNMHRFLEGSDIRITPVEHGFDTPPTQ